MPSLTTVVATMLGVLTAGSLPPLPRPIAGQFVGSIGDTVVVAGGSWWSRPGEPEAKKVWGAGILTLQPTAREWTAVGRLPEPLGYGGTASIRNRVVMTGGEDGKKFSRRVFALEQTMGAIRLVQWPPLPHPLAYFSMAATDNHIYIVGGQTAPGALANAELWSLAVDAKGNPVGEWQQESSLPSDGRILAAAGGCGDQLYVASGAALVKMKDGSIGRHYLRDFWSYDPVHGWMRLPDLPRTAVGAPALCSAAAGLVIFGGDDRLNTGASWNPAQKPPVFSKSILRYDFHLKKWLDAGEIPHSLVTTGTALLSNGDVVIPGGEDHPGSRSAVVLRLHISR
jgi:N-acetylneuraminate epimerase